MRLARLRLPVRTILAKAALTASNAAMVGMLLMSVFMAGFATMQAKQGYVVERSDLSTSSACRK
jgi:hypothetical protein